MRTAQKEQAIRMRKEGKTYREILAEIPIAKSTLSDWLKSVQLAQPQIQRITKLRLASARRGAQARKNKRLSEIGALNTQGKLEVGVLTQRELWLIGTALHWAEGSKQCQSTPSAGVIFTNSDPNMFVVFLAWLKEIGVQDKDRVFELYVHDSRKEEVPAFKKWWARRLGITSSLISSVYFKRDKIKTNRKNVADLYHGLIRIRVRSSTSLNRRINGWIEGIVHQDNWEIV